MIISVNPLNSRMNEIAKDIVYRFLSTLTAILVSRLQHWDPNQTGVVCGTVKFDICVSRQAPYELTPISSAGMLYLYLEVFREAGVRNLRILLII